METVSGQCQNLNRNRLQTHLEHRQYLISGWRQDSQSDGATQAYATDHNVMIEEAGVAR